LGKFATWEGGEKPGRKKKKGKTAKRSIKIKGVLAEGDPKRGVLLICAPGKGDEGESFLR